MRKKNSKVLPVYSIDTFQSGEGHSHYFHIKRLEKHVREFKDMIHPHRHDFYMIVFVTHGTCMHAIDFSVYQAKPFSVFFITPGQVHSWNFSADAKGFVLFFTTSFYSLYRTGQSRLYDFPFFHMLNKPGHLQMKPKRDARLVGMCEEMLVENSDHEYGRDEMLCNCLDIMLIRMSRYYHPSALTQKSVIMTQKIRTLLLLIEKHYKELKLPRDYASLMHITTDHLNDISKTALKRTVSQLIHERKILEAKRLLVYTDRTVVQIADQLDFNDKSYFIRFFKRYTGSTPDQFRQPR